MRGYSVTATRTKRSTTPRVRATHKLTEYVRKAPEVTPHLPLVHTTDTWAFRAVILGPGTLEPQPDLVLDDIRLYLYYGRPAYRPNSGSPPTSVPGYAPVCFVLAPDCLPSIERIYPFDSGAFSGKFYAPHVHDRMTLDDFALDPQPGMAARVVGAFFGTNEAYFYGTAIRTKTFDPLELEAQCYYNLIVEQGTTSYDDRRGTIEITIKVPLTLSSSTVRAVVLPKTLLDSPEVQTTLKAWGAEILSYTTSHAKPTEFISQIRAKTEEYLKQNGYI